MAGKRRETAKHRRVFEVWYKDERDFAKTYEHIGEQDRPRAISTLYNWCSWYGWEERANDRDRKAAQVAEREAIKRKAEMLQRHALLGRSLQGKGAKYLNDQGIDNGSQAVAAIKTGVEIERKAEGLPDWVAEILGKDDDELRAEFSRLSAVLGGPGRDDAPGDRPDAEQPG